MAKIFELKGKERDKIYGTSFHYGTINASVNEVEKKLGVKVRRVGADKVNYEVDLSINGITATIYDWKEDDISRDTVVSLHIGTHTAEESKTVASILKSEYGLDATYKTWEEMLAGYNIKK